MMRSYPGGGYVNYLDCRNESAYLDTLAMIGDTNWFDVSTRALFITFNTYNPSLDLLVVLRAFFEIDNSGTLFPNHQCFCLHTQLNDTTTTLLTVFGELLTLFLLVLSILDL
mmetsp:Transcript_13570/g.6709  ORF Transcript_13570/g.6709 Transcript_13570/m.6709 type:complete len:112 (-) Transcript_13570:378-713(-)